MQTILIDQEAIQRKITYFENVIGKLSEAIELETDFERIVKLENLLEDAKHELISVRLELEWRGTENGRATTKNIYL